MDGKNIAACAILAGLTILAPGAAAAGDNCKPLTILSSIDMLRVENEAAILVDAKIDDHEQVMLLDTGGVFSEISAQAATALNLTQRESGLELVGVSGTTTSRVVHAHSFSLGRLKATSVDFMVAEGLNGQPFAGIIAPNLLTSYDLEFDFAAHKFNLLSSDHCPGKVIYWPASAATVVPIRVTRSGHILVEAVLDGIKIDALVDTGAARTVLSLPTAEQAFAITPGAQDTPAVGHLEGKPHAVTYRHRFRQLTIGGVGVGNPAIALVPDLMSNQLSRAPALGSRLSDADETRRLPDLIIGMDVLHRLHLYIAYAEEKLYVTPAAPPPIRPSDGANQAARALRGGP